MVETGDLTRDDVVWVYRTFLGRDPESEAVVQNHLSGNKDIKSLCERVIKSNEYLTKIGANLIYEQWDRQLTSGHLTSCGHIINGRNISAGYLRGCLMVDNKFRTAVCNDWLFKESYELAKGITIVSLHNLINIFLIMKYGLRGISGDIVEFGSYRGGSAIFMSNIAKYLYPEKLIYAFDTYEGMPPTQEGIDRHREGDFSTCSIEHFEQKLKTVGLTNCIPIKGKFENTFPKAQECAALEKIALAHVDCDIYSAVHYTVETAMPMMVNAGMGTGYFVFDDPLVASCLGAFQAVEDTLIKAGAHAEQTYPHLVYRWPPVNSGISSFLENPGGGG